jgi:hypothetical protein
MKVEIIVFSKMKPNLLILEGRHISIRIIKTHIIDNSKIIYVFLGLTCIVN